jgi:hypothetical protein
LWNLADFICWPLKLLQSISWFSLKSMVIGGNRSYEIDYSGEVLGSGVVGATAPKQPPP